MRIVGSLAIHALLAIGLYAVHRPPAIELPSAPLTIEVVSPPHATLEPEPGGGASISAPRMRARAPMRHAAPPTELTSIVGEVTIDRGIGTGHGGGSGTGDGIGIGDGIGSGRGARELAQVPPPPSAPPAIVARTSLARPARLIFPSRQVEIEEAALFVARLTVDDDGFVVGAKLARGFGGKRDDDALGAVFRFRYDPARDDEGRAIRSTVEQHFDLAR